MFIKENYLKGLALLFVVSSCSNEPDDTILNEQDKVSTNIINMVDDIPTYPDMSSFVSQCVNLATMEDRSQFQSLWTLYDNASDEYSDLENMEQYYEWKSNYNAFFLFAEDEEYQAIGLKVEDMIYAYGLNIYGEAMIGGKLLNFNKVSDIREWDEILPQLKSVRTPIGSVCAHRASKRKLRCYQKSITVQGGTKCWLVYISGQKKGVFGWNNYSGGRHIRPASVSLGFSAYNRDYNEAYYENTTLGTPTSPANFDEKYTWRVYQSSYAQILFVWTDGVGESNACTL